MDPHGKGRPTTARARWVITSVPDSSGEYLADHWNTANNKFLEGS